MTIGRGGPDAHATATPPTFAGSNGNDLDSAGLRGSVSEGGCPSAAAASAIGQAIAMRREVMESPWPSSREAGRAIRWKLGELDDLLRLHSQVADEEADPYGVLPEGFWDDPQARALEYLEDQALKAATAARKRLAEYRSREAVPQDEVPF
jgi:hypothetical protein